MCVCACVFLGAMSLSSESKIARLQFRYKIDFTHTIVDIGTLPYFGSSY